MSPVSHSVIVILGPTASGKSSLGVRLAKKFNGVIISADSRQVYRGMNIGTGKVTKQEMLGVPHYLLDVASPTGQYSVARYVRDVQRVMKRIPATTPIFLVGGTPFYIDAILNPLSFSPVPPNPALRKNLSLVTTAQLVTKLKKIDPQRALTIDTKNSRRVIRAIEVASFKGKVTTPLLPPMNILKIGITLPKKRLYQNIDRRVDFRMKQGMLNEIRKLHAAGLSWKKLDSFGLEYRFLGRHLQAVVNKQEAITQLKSAIHHFAKRQMTWWKRDQDIIWISPHKNPSALVKKFWIRKTPRLSVVSIQSVQ